MSVWTHVAGILRLNLNQGDRLTDEELIEIVKNTLGVTLPRNIGDLETEVGQKLWDEFEASEHKVPCGAEGSLQYDIALTYDAHSTSRVVVTIWGDLRGVGYIDMPSIERWLKKSLRRWTLEPRALGWSSAQLTIMPEDWTPVYFIGMFLEGSRTVMLKQLK